MWRQGGSCGLCMDVDVKAKGYLLASYVTSLSLYFFRQVSRWSVWSMLAIHSPVSAWITSACHLAQLSKVVSGDPIQVFMLTQQGLY